MHKKLWQATLMLAMAFSGPCILAQTVEQIKADDRFWSAEGTGSTIKAAENDALGRIARQFSVEIASSFKETDLSQEGFVKTFAYAKLQNVQMRELQEEPNAKVFCWVSKNDVNQMIESRKQKVLDFIQAGRRAEMQLQIDDALRNYHWALMLSKVVRPGGVMVQDRNNNMVDAQVYLCDKIHCVIAGIKAKVENSIYENNRYLVRVRFTYNDEDVASLQIKYYDGQAFEGPLVVRNGLAELELVRLSADSKLEIKYEYKFSDEAGTLDKELEVIYAEVPSLKIDATAKLPVKVDKKTNTVVADKRISPEGSFALPAPTESVATTENISIPKRMELKEVGNSASYYAAMRKVEAAILNGSPAEAKSCFTDEGYELFALLFNNSYKLTLVGTNQQYEFVDAGNQILAHYCKVKIKHKNGKTFMENLTFRFDPESKKINSLAYALTRKAEADIFDAAKRWPEVSRFAILQFMEDYQTAYAFKRLDYISQIFSDDAIIIRGTVIEKAKDFKLEGEPVYLPTAKDVVYTRETKEQYLNTLKYQFKNREYIHLTFEDNETRSLQPPRIEPGRVFAIQISQLYDSPQYSDKGYLTLMLDLAGELPLITVRFWRPEKTGLMKMDDFVNKFEF